MRLIICGAGVIGSNLARYLSDEGHEINLIEQRQSTAKKASEKLDVRVIVGSATEPSTLETAGVAQSDMVIAVTNTDVSNLIICSLAAAYGAKRRIARVRDPSLKDLLQKFGMAHFHVDEIINPDRVAAEAIVKVMAAPGSREVADFADGKVLLRSFDIHDDSPLVNLKLEDLKEKDFPWPFLLVAINRGGSIVIPHGQDNIETGDRIYTLLPRPSLAEFLTFVHPSVRLPRKVIIYGATNTGESLAMDLSKTVPEVVLLEENRVLAERVAGSLNSVTVINGAASEADILRECGVEASDAFIAVSANDHSNLISAVLAKKLGAKTTVITTQQPDYEAIVSALDINVVINPRLLATDQILRLVRGGRISTVATLPECKAEVLELIPEPDSPVTKKPIRQLKFPKKSIIGAIIRDSEVILAAGDTQVQEGEQVVVFCQEDVVPQVQKFFSKRKLL
ncbi:MAG: Trk system potassium transporter TrkA [bacterium]|nr:MAG: Trk system potassium transporter TrkA [bacterium]